MTNADDSPFQPHGQLQQNYRYCASDGDRKSRMSKISGPSCRDVLFLAAINSELLEITPQVCDFLVAPDTRKNHLGTRNLGARIPDIFLECFFVPGDAGVLVCIAVVKALNSASRAAVEAVEDRPNLVGGILTDAMTRGAFSE